MYSTAWALQHGADLLYSQPLLRFSYNVVNNINALATDPLYTDPLTSSAVDAFLFSSSSSCATFSLLASACHTLCARTSASE